MSFPRINLWSSHYSLKSHVNLAMSFPQINVWSSNYSLKSHVNHFHNSKPQLEAPAVEGTRIELEMPCDSLAA